MITHVWLLLQARQITLSSENDVVLAPGTVGTHCEVRTPMTV